MFFFYLIFYLFLFNKTVKDVLSLLSVSLPVRRHLAFWGEWTNYKAESEIKKGYYQVIRQYLSYSCIDSVVSE